MNRNVYANLPLRLGDYYLLEQLGSGYSGSVHRAQHLRDGRVVALKVQHVNHECPTNRYERYIYPLLKDGTGIPHFWDAGVERQWDYLAIELLGPSLDSLYKRSGKEIMDLRSVCCIAVQVISRLEFMHSRGILHRDIQLGNCAIGLPPNDRTIYMIDFGYSKQYVDPLTRLHIPDSTAQRNFIGNYWFSSVGVHCLGRVPTRRDDLESAALMFIHLLTPRGLPWTRRGVPKTENEHEVLKRAKRSARPEDLCRGIPVVFEDFLRYCRTLGFSDCPDYARWRREFRELMIENGFTNIDQFIWPPPVPQYSPLPPPPPYISRMPRQAHPRMTLAQDFENMFRGNGSLHVEGRQLASPRNNRPVQYAVVERVTQNAWAKQEYCTATSGTEKVVAQLDTATSSESEDEGYNKGYHLIRLAKKVKSTTDKKKLANIVQRAVKILRDYNTSTWLTKEGFAFLVALEGQLSKPTVSNKPRYDHPIHEKEPPHVRLEVAARLMTEVKKAPDSQALAKMVSNFSDVMQKSRAKTITKDGFAFLEGLAARLRILE